MTKKDDLVEVKYEIILYLTLKRICNTKTIYEKTLKVPFKINKKYEPCIFTHFDNQYYGKMKHDYQDLINKIETGTSKYIYDRLLEDDIELSKDDDTEIIEILTNPKTDVQIRKRIDYLSIYKTYTLNYYMNYSSE